MKRFEIAIEAEKHGNRRSSRFWFHSVKLSPGSQPEEPVGPNNSVKPNPHALMTQHLIPLLAVASPTIQK